VGFKLHANRGIGRYASELGSRLLRDSCPPAHPAGGVTATATSPQLLGELLGARASAPKSCAGHHAPFPKKRHNRDTSCYAR
jgi:hypothetical protein